MTVDVSGLSALQGSERAGKWRKARYRAEVHEIQARHSEYETIGEPTVIKGPSEMVSLFKRG